MMNIPDKDKTILRDLARRAAEIGNLPIQQQKADMWRRHNDLERVRPMVLIFPEGGIFSTEDEARSLAEFRPMFFQASVDTGCPVIPVGIKHLAPDDPKVWVWEEGIGIYEHIMTRVLTASALEVEVRFAPPMVAGEREGRKELARRAHDEVSRLIA